MQRKAIDDWRANLSAARRADFDVFFRNLVKKSKWQKPDIDGLVGKHLASLCELRWKSEKVPHRIGGYFSKHQEFVMLVGFTHNQRKYDPPTALEMLPKRKKQIEQKEAKLSEFKIASSR